MTLSSLRVTFVLSSLELSGGVRAVIEIANRLSARGHRVALATPGDSIAAEMRAVVRPSVALIESSVPGHANPRAYGRNLRLLWSLARALPPSDCLIATHTPTTLVTPAARLLPANRRATPFWLYMDYPEMFAGRPVERWLLAHALAWHRAALSISRAGVEEARRAVPGGASYYVGVGLADRERFYPLPGKTFGRDGRYRLLYVGDARPRKGLADFLAAAALIGREWPIELWLVVKELLAAPPDLPHRCFVRPDDAALAALYRESDLYVSTSWREGVGLPPLEAMASGTAVVLTDTVGARDYARHGENCLLTPPRDPRALAGAIAALLAAPALAERLVRAGLETARAFDYDRVVDRLEAIVRRETAAPGHRGDHGNSPL